MAWGQANPSSTRDPTSSPKGEGTVQEQLGLQAYMCPCLVGLLQSYIPILAVPEPSHANLGISLGVDTSWMRSCFLLVPNLLP